MKLLSASVFFLIFAQAFYPQEENEISVNDSVKIGNNKIEKLLFQLEEFEFYRDLTELKRSFEMIHGTAKLLLKAALGMSNKSTFESENDLTPGYLHSPLYEQYLENSKFNPVRTALGMIQAGAVGYLAYRHIKKWVIKK